MFSKTIVVSFDDDLLLISSFWKIWSNVNMKKSCFETQTFYLCMRSSNNAFIFHKTEYSWTSAKKCKITCTLNNVVIFSFSVMMMNDKIVSLKFVICVSLILFARLWFDWLTLSESKIIVIAILDDELILLIVFLSFFFAIFCFKWCVAFIRFANVLRTFKIVRWNDTRFVKNKSMIAIKLLLFAIFVRFLITNFVTFIWFRSNSFAHLRTRIFWKNFRICDIFNDQKYNIKDTVTETFAHFDIVHELIWIANDWIFFQSKINENFRNKSMNLFSIFDNKISLHKIDIIRRTMFENSLCVESFDLLWIKSKIDVMNCKTKTFASMSFAKKKRFSCDFDQWFLRVLTKCNCIVIFFTNTNDFMMISFVRNDIEIHIVSVRKICKTHFAWMFCTKFHEVDQCLLRFHIFNKN